MHQNQHSVTISKRGLQQELFASLDRLCPLLFALARIQPAYPKGDIKGAQVNPDLFALGQVDDILLSSLADCL